MKPLRLTLCLRLVLLQLLIVPGSIGWQVQPQPPQRSQPDPRYIGPLAPDPSTLEKDSSGHIVTPRRIDATTDPAIQPKQPSAPAPNGTHVNVPLRIHRTAIHSRPALVVGDWAGVGSSQAGVYRSGTWILDSDGTHTYQSNWIFQFGGSPFDMPVVGKW